MSPSDHDLRWLLELTALPTAAGREQRVIDWIERWAAERPDLTLRRDEAGNLVLNKARSTNAATPSSGPRPLFITAHLDHPAFVVERVLGPATLLASFRGGVQPLYFNRAAVEVFAAEGEALAGVVVEHTKKEPFAECLIELESAGAPAERCRPGDVARWALPASRIEDGVLHAPACDDLAAVAAALATMERLRGRAETNHVALLFTRAEEVGFIGAIAACKLGTIPTHARVISLENSRAFAESPVGGGVIVRVGDRISTFSPALTGAVAKVAERLATRDSSTPTPGTSASPNGSRDPRIASFKWQRKLMPGGACEASVFQAYGYEATCVCLPLGNYHNQAGLERVQAGDAEAAAGARVAPEFIAIADYLGMIALLEACALGLEHAEPLTTRLERMYAEKLFVLRS